MKKYAGGVAAAAVVLASVVALAGCSSSHDDAPPPSGRATAPYVTYPSAEKLKDDATAAGLTCSSWSGVLKTSGAESFECQDGTALLTVWPGRDGVGAEVTAAKTNIMNAGGGTVLVGPNWFINAPDVDLDTIMPTIGGILEAVPSA